jgi:D-serine dehydratase
MPAGEAIGTNMPRGEILLPACTLRDRALRANSRTMLQFLHRLGRELEADIVLCPHAKTTTSPDSGMRKVFYLPPKK